MNWYQNKAEFYRKQWELATDSGKQKAADSHMANFVNYTRFVDEPELQAKHR